MRTWKVIMMALLAVSLAACGKVSDEQKTDVANVLGGLTARNASSGTGLQARGEAPSSEVARYIADTTRGFAWVARFQAEVQQSGGNKALTDHRTALTSCSAGSYSGEGASCTATCPSEHSFSLSCTSSASSSYACNGTTYTMSDLSFTLGMDTTNVTSSGSSTTGTIAINFSFGANITGGKLDGGKLECAMNMSVDLATATSDDAALSVDCSNFSCKWDGREIACEDLKSKMENSDKACS